MNLIALLRCGIRRLRISISVFQLLGEARFSVGDNVRKIGGDYTFEGVVVSVCRKLSGTIRYVVEDDRGVLHVYSDKTLAPR
jgi:hypothetical protein